MDDTTRTPESLKLEAEYWRQVLNVLTEASGHLSAAADALARGHVVAFGLITADNLPGALLEHGNAANAAMGELRGIQGSLMQLGELAGGRLVPLYHEAGLDTAELDS